MKQCITCKEIKDETEFYKRGGFRNGKPRNGISTECKVCHRLRTKNNSSPQKRRYNIVKFKFGISKDEYNKLVKDFPVCAICKNEFKKNEPHVDHCHTTGKVRGLLCGGCNVGLGMFRENSEILANAIDYLTMSLAADCPILEDIPAINPVLKWQL